MKKGERSEGREREEEEGAVDESELVGGTGSEIGGLAPYSFALPCRASIWLCCIMGVCG